MKTIYRMKPMLTLLTVPLIALAAQQPTTVSPTLIDKVRNATEQFKDVNVAIAAGFVPGTLCVIAPDGITAIHFVLPTLLTQSIGSADVRIDLPQALIYEPLANGSLRLVGVEYIVLASAWTRQHPGADPPALEGQPLSLVDRTEGYRRADYRHSLSAFYELPVMAWEQNRVASFADWNTALSCVRMASNGARALEE